MGAVKNAFLYDVKATCRECAGEGEVISTAQPMRDYSDCPYDDTVQCPHCTGSGECDCDDCMSDAAEAAHERMVDGEPPLSADERHQMAWREKQELRR